MSLLLSMNRPGRLGALAALALVTACAAQIDDAATGGNVGFGGAQDIGQFRNILQRGELPGVDTLDANGFFAEHYVELPAPTCGQPLCVTPMLARGKSWLTNRPDTTLQLAITTPIDASTLPHRPLNLVVVVDRSGSMESDERLTKVQRGLRLLTEQLRAEDRVALVSFDDRVKVEAAFGATPEALGAAIDRLSPRGATNIYDGLRTGMELAATAASSAAGARETRVILLSDGLANVGTIASDAIVRMAESYVSDGIGLTTIGVGLQFDVKLMRTLAERGAGNYYFLEDPQAVDEVFTQELAISMTPLALELKVDVIASAGITLGAATGPQGWQPTGTGRGTLSLPAAFAASRTGVPSSGRRGGGGALFVDLLGVSTGASVVRVDFSYRVPGATQRQQQSLVVAPLAPPAETSPQPEVSHLAMIKHVAMYNLYRGLHEAAARAPYDASCALGGLEQTGRAGAVWNQVFEDADVTADLALVDRFIANLRQRGTVESTTSTESCLAAPVYTPTPYGDDVQYQRACSTSTAPQGALLLVLVALGARRPRRRGKVSG